MSYVIQNFSDINKKVAMTPRIKFLLFFNNLNKFFIFLKYNTFLFFINKSYDTKIRYCFLFDKFFFSRQYFKYMYRVNFDLVNIYDNSFSRSLAHKIFHQIMKYNFKTPCYSSPDSVFFDELNYTFNQYLVTLKLINIKLQKAIFKNTFFYFMLIFSQIWWQKQKNIKFYLNFLFTFYNLKTFRFYSGYFLRTYNF